MEIVKTTKPKIAIVGGVHGDEPIGKLAINELKKLKLKEGFITFITAHQQAVKKKKRFIKKDLNRSFPGKIRGG